MNMPVAPPIFACQRPLFDMPPDVAYFDSAAYSPLPRTVADAGTAGLDTKRQPWARDPTANDRWTARARAAAAVLVGARAEDMAVVSSVGHGLTVALENLPLPPGSRLLRLADEHSSLVLALDRVARERGAVVEAVERPADHDWTAAILAALHRPGAPPVSVAALTPLHWTDGALVDLAALAPVLRGMGAALVVDATQAAGAVPVDVARLRPDFLAFPTYKWLLGPFGMGWLYAAPHRQAGRPLDEHAGNQAATASRYDRGERNDPANMPMAATGMELVAGWGPPAVSSYLARLTATLADGLAELGAPVLPARFRSPHILGVRLPGLAAAAAVAGLEARGVFASNRLGLLRISPHVWADGADVTRFTSALRAVLTA